MIYGITICLFFVLRLAKEQWKRKRKQPDFKAKENAPLILSYAIWLPISIIWGLATLRIFDVFGKSLDDPNVALLATLAGFYFLFVVPTGGMVLTQAATYLSDFFNP